MLTVGVACFNALHRTKAFWGGLLASLPYGAQVVAVDNGSADGTGDWLRQNVMACERLSPASRVIRNPENVGIFRAYNQIAAAAAYENVAFLHNDLHLYDPRWHEKVGVRLTAGAGVVGFAGALKAEPDGGRSYFLSSLLEWSLHGGLLTGPARVAVLDGMALCTRRAVLDRVGGFPAAWAPHHYYDKWLCLSAWKAGCEVWAEPVPCHHDSGATAGSPEYLPWLAGVLGVPADRADQEAHDRNREAYLAEFRGLLPFTVR